MTRESVLVDGRTRTLTVVPPQQTGADKVPIGVAHPRFLLGLTAPNHRS